MFSYTIALLGNILRHSVGSILLGIILAVAFVFLLFYIIRGFYPKRTFSPLSIITGAVLVVLLFPPIVVICGATAIKARTADVAVWLDQTVVHSDQYPFPVPITAEESNYIVDCMIDRYPMVKFFVGEGEFTGFDTSNICEAISSELNSFLNQFIWESLGWCILFLASGAFIVIFTLDRNEKRKLNAIRGSASGMTSTTTYNHSSRQRYYNSSSRTTRRF